MHRYSKFLQPALMASASMFAVISAPSLAQDAGQQAPSVADQRTPEAIDNEAPVPPRAGGDAQDIVVTASRVGRTGFVAPTPTTTLSAVDLGNTAAASAADLLNRSPAFTASVTPAAAGPQVTGTPGANFLNLRGLGTNRTLVLVDGHRHVPTSATGVIDVNLIPSILISNIDVVTGGASAAWGSDAVSGVVNFILDKNVNGLRGNVQQGISQAGDQSQRLIQQPMAWAFSTTGFTSQWPANISIMMVPASTAAAIGATMGGT